MASAPAVLRDRPGQAHGPAPTEHASESHAFRIVFRMASRSFGTPFTFLQESGQNHVFKALAKWARPIPCLLYNALMLTKVWLKNFKLHAETELEARPITVLIGPNNSGKSSLFQALLLLRQAASRSGADLCRAVPRRDTSTQNPYFFDEEQLIDLGDFEHAVRHGEQSITIGAAGSVDNPKSSGFIGPLKLNLEVNARQNRLSFHRGKLDYVIPAARAEGGLAWEWSVGRPAQQISPPIQIAGVQLLFQPIESFQMLSGGGTSYSGGSPPPPETMAEIGALSQHIAGAPVKLLNSLHPIFPLRGLEEWGCPLTDRPARSLERMSVADRTVALLRILAYDLDLQEKVSQWLEELIQVRIKVKLLPGKRVTLLSLPVGARNGDSLFTNEGTGANQLPFILVPVGLTPPGESMWLCEPEAHLHPRAQSNLVSHLLTIAKRDNRQFFVETHSEHLLHSLLFAVAKGELSRSDLAIYYFEKKDGRADCRKLDVDEKGRVDGGLPGFFERSLDELFEYLEAVKKT